MVDLTGEMAALWAALGPARPDRGRVVQRGPHAVLVTQEGSVYAGLHASWIAQHSQV